MCDGVNLMGDGDYRIGSWHKGQVTYIIYR
jgi:hypothetical protein